MVIRVDIFINKDELQQKALAYCKNSNSSSSLSLEKRLVHLSNSEKTCYIECIVEILNTNYPEITHLDLSWNELYSNNISPLLNLKFVTHLDLKWNNIDTDEKKDSEALQALKNKFKKVHHDLEENECITNP